LCKGRVALSNKNGKTSEESPSIPTSWDVARLAGVSRTSVSYVLNGTRSEHVSAETRARVLAAIEELGYHPSSSARALRQGHTNEIAVILDLAPIWIDVMRQMQGDATDLGYVVAPHLYWSASADRGRALLSRVIGLRPAGIVTNPELIPPDLVQDGRYSGGIPFVYLHLEPVNDFPTIWLRVVDAGYIAATHLLDQGRRHLAFVEPKAPVLAAQVSLRRAGMERAMAMREDVAFSSVSMDASVADARRVVRDWLRAGALPTGVYCYTDEYAFPLLAALHENKIAIPDDIAVVGTDDTFFCDLCFPTLTSIRFDTVGIGRRAVHIIDALRRGYELPPELAKGPAPYLIHRGSS
jgi:LacI family transcriptional regulator